MIDLQRNGPVFTLTMTAGENRWNTAFVRAFAAALDTVEASEGPAALVVTSALEKFFSNGLDLAWVQSTEPGEGGDQKAFSAEFMQLMGRIITFPVPTISAINGHAFGAGFMLALCTDVRVMRADRGFCCANELAIGMRIPDEELALFRHKLSGSAFFDTVQLARRWSAPEAVAAGFVAEALPLEDLLAGAQARAEALAPLGANRELFGNSKERVSGRALHQPCRRAAHLLAAARLRGSPCAWELSSSQRCWGPRPCPGATCRRRLCAEGPADLYCERCLLDRRARREGRSHRLVGSAADARAMLCAGVEEIDLGSAVIYPGFTDSHQHLEGVGRRTKTLSLFGIPTQRRRWGPSGPGRKRSRKKAGCWAGAGLSGNGPMSSASTRTMLTPSPHRRSSCPGPMAWPSSTAELWSSQALLRTPQTLKAAASSATPRANLRVTSCPGHGPLPGHHS